MVPAAPNIIMESLLPGSSTAPQSQALTNILAVTRREWQVAGQEPVATGHGRRRRRDQFARRAARAFEAQVMALRCRQAIVVA
ncbi:hypothetical protein UB46_15790 [Burkholderiaceae bacterium 16]|nr:hypothetical protein UB46_15790 [Burkholderiaceae bacterium 16]